VIRRPWGSQRAETLLHLEIVQAPRGGPEAVLHNPLPRRHPASASGPAQRGRLQDRFLLQIEGWKMLKAWRASSSHN